jgi:glycosyltransferase involved in cell wall biosynthesis
MARALLRPSDAHASREGETREVRVLHVLGVMDRGGAETRTVELMHQLRESRFRLDVCTLSGRRGFYDDEIRRLGGQVLPCPLEPTITFPLRFMMLLRRGRYDIVHSQVHQFSGYLLTLARFIGVRHRIAHIRSTSDGQDDTWSRRRYRRAMRALMDLNASRIIGVSASALHSLWGSAWSTDRKKVVVYDGIEPSRYEPRWDRRATRAELNVSADAEVVVHVGRFVRAKNHAALLPIARALHMRRPNAVLVLAGDGPLRPSIERGVARKGLSGMVRMLGARSDVPRLLHASDVLVFPSLWEGLGDVVIEALAAGIPVVANPIPSVLEVARHAPGITTADPSDSAGFARAIDSVLQEPPSLRGLPFPPEFTAKVSARRIVECYSA